MSVLCFYKVSVYKHCVHNVRVWVCNTSLSTQSHSLPFHLLHISLLPLISAPLVQRNTHPTCFFLPIFTDPLLMYPFLTFRGSVAAHNVLLRCKHAFVNKQALFCVIALENSQAYLLLKKSNVSTGGWRGSLPFCDKKQVNFLCHSRTNCLAKKCRLESAAQT